MSCEKSKKKSFPKDAAEAIRKALSESIPEAITRALSGRENVIMVRINEESLAKIDELVETGIFKSRSESAAFLLREGIKARTDLFEKISEKIKQIQSLKEELQEALGEKMNENKKQED